MFYAGIGARSTPSKILEVMSDLALSLNKKEGLILRSGSALGADSAFEIGAGENKEIFTAKSNIPDWAMKTVYKYHPNPMALKEYSFKLHARNALILLGADGSSPVDFVVCWTPDGKFSGGTGQALRIASDIGIPIYNLQDAECMDYVINYINRN